MLFKNKQQGPSRQRSQNHYEPTTVDLTKSVDASEEAEYEDPNAGHLYQAIPANATYERDGGYTKVRNNTLFFLLEQFYKNNEAQKRQKTRTI